MKQTDEFTLKLINDEALLQLFNELTPKVQDKIVNDGMKNVARLIIKDSKTNFQGIKKGKSKTNYADFSKSFEIRNLKSGDGIIAGLKFRQGYKYRFLNFGTEERMYRTKKGKEHRTGKIEKTDWWTNAVKDNENIAEERISNAITKSMEKTVARYERKYIM